MHNPAIASGDTTLLIPDGTWWPQFPSLQVGVVANILRYSCTLLKLPCGKHWTKVIGPDGNAPIQQSYWVYIFVHSFGSAFRETSEEAVCYLNTDSESAFGFNTNIVEAKRQHVRTEQDFAKTLRSSETQTRILRGRLSRFLEFLPGEAQNREVGEDSGPGSMPLPLNVCGRVRYISRFLLCTLCALSLLAPGQKPPPDVFLRHSSLVSNQH